MLFIDLETRSNVDLKKKSLYEYVTDLSTEVICLCYSINGGEVQTWFADTSTEYVLKAKNNPLPPDLLDYIANTDQPIFAHNAEFERLIFDYVLANDYDFIPPKLNRWRCTLVQALASGLPGALGSLSRVLCLSTPKLSEGKRLIDTYSAPGYTELWAAGDRDLMSEYCATDVSACNAVYEKTRRLSETEWAQYSASQAINDAGIPFGLRFCAAAATYADKIKMQANGNIQRITDNAVISATARKTRDAWLKSNLSAEAYESLLVTRVTLKGHEVKVCFDERMRSELALRDDLPEAVHAFLEQVESAGGAATKKYAAVNRLNVAGRVYGTLQFNGARTGRYSAKGGLQIQNFKRDCAPNPDDLIARVIDGDALESPAKTLAALSRAAITSDQGITYADYAQIEARVLPWLAKSEQANDLIASFYAGEDLYTTNARIMFNTDDVTTELRQASKVATLACGFGGGFGSVQQMAKTYGLRMSEEKANTVKAQWRNANPWAEPLWYGLKRAAMDAVNRPLIATQAARIMFVYHGDYLYMQLPSKRFIAYYQPKIEVVGNGSKEKGTYFETEEITALWPAAKPKARDIDWPRCTVNHLVLAENATQAVAADVMREAIVSAVDAGIKVIFSVHDELVAEGNCAEELEAVMLEQPEWAIGLPIAVETKFNKRYGK